VAGVAVDRRTVADLEGERGAVAGVRLTDGDVIPIDGGFVRPRWSPSLEFLSDVDIDRDEAGCTFRGLEELSDLGLIGVIGDHRV